MKNESELIVMLTHHDQTVMNAFEIFDQCKDTKVNYWGFKEEPLPLEEMKELYRYMKSYGKKTVLEVVAYSEKEGLAGAQKAVDCGCDILMGTMYSDRIHELCRNYGIRYMPFVGTVTGRPSILEGTPEDMIEEARGYLRKGVYGIDLLGYRYTGNAAALNDQFVKELQAPVCLAGSIDSFQRLDEVKTASPMLFTIGGAFFENRFGSTFKEQIEKVYDYMME